MKEEEAGDHRPRTVLNTSESQSFNYVQGKTDTETNYEICLGVHFALRVNKYIKQYASKRSVSLVNYWYTYTCAHTHAHTHTHTHAHTHTHTHTRRCARCMDACTPIEMFENGFIFNRTLKHHNFWKFDWTHVLWSEKERISFWQFVIETISFFQLITGSTALEFTWTQISVPLGQYLGIPYPSTQLTPSSAWWCHYLTLRHRHRSRKHLQCRSPSQSLPGFGCTRLLCENSLQVSSMDRVLTVLDLSQ